MKIKNTAFRNNYLAAFLLTILILFSAASQAQVRDGLYHTPITPPYSWKSGWFKTNLSIPIVQATSGIDTGSIYYRLSDSTIVVWTGYQWRTLGGGAGSTDSSVFATRYYTQQTFVPYENATGSVNLGPWGLTTDRFVFNQTPTLAGGERIMRWNDTDGTLDVGMKGGNVTLQVGQEQHSRARNNTGSTITNGQVVYISGSTGTNTTIALARANASSTSKATIGIATEDISNGQSGFVTTFGKVRDINTSALTEGGLVYLSSTTAGGFTSTAPTGDTYPIVIGVCERSHATQGVIFVHIDKEYVRQYELDTAKANIRSEIGGGGSADSTYQTVEIGTAQGKIGTILNETFSGGSIPSGWTKGGNLTTNYTGGKVNIIGATYWNAPSTNQNTTPYLSAMQYDTERMPWEKQSGYIDIVPQTKSAGAVVALTHGSNGAFFTSREVVAWDLSNGANSGRVAIGTDSIAAFTTLQDSTEKMAFSTTDSLRLYWEKDGWNVTAGIINKTTGRKTTVKFGQTWNGIGGRFNFVFLNGTYDVTRIKVDANDRVGGTWFVGHSRVSGSGATSEQNRYANQLFNSNYKYYGVMGLPAVSSQYFLDGGITEEVINRAAPVYVVLDLFSNDIADAGSTPAQIKVFADSIGSRFDRAGSDVNILGQFVASATDNILNDSLFNLCVERGWTFIDIDTALLTGSGGVVKAQYSTDAVHYNDSGNVIIAQKIRAKIGFKIFQEVVADTTYKIKFHGLEDATFKNGYKVLVADNQGRVGTVANQFLNPSQYIRNQFTTNSLKPATVAQQNSIIHISGPVTSDSSLVVRSTQGLRIGFNNDDNNSTTGANINITNLGFSGVGSPQAFDDITGSGNIKIIASGTGKAKGSIKGTISGTNNTLINASANTTFSGSSNTVIGSTVYEPTTGSNNLGLGPRALHGQTTGSSVIHLDNGSGTTAFSGSLSNATIIGDNRTYDAYLTGDVALNPNFSGSVTRLWVGGRANQGMTSEIHGSANGSGDNLAAPDFSIFLGRGTGTNTGGKFMIKSWDATGSGSTLQSTSNTEITVTRDSIQIDAVLQVNGTSTKPQIQIGSKTVTATPVNGAVEYDGTDYFVTSGGTRYTLNRSLTGSAALDFGSTAAQSSADLTITVTGAADGDVVTLGVPNGSTLTNSSFTAWVSAANTVTVRFNNYSSGSQDPASGTFKVRVIK